MAFAGLLALFSACHQYYHKSGLGPGPVLALFKIKLFNKKKNSSEIQLNQITKNDNEKYLLIASKPA